MNAAVANSRSISGFQWTNQNAMREQKESRYSKIEASSKKGHNMSRDPLDQRAPYPISAPRYSVSHQMVTTAFELPNFRITQNLGIVRGIVVRSRNIFATIGAGFQMV